MQKLGSMIFKQYISFREMLFTKLLVHEFMRSTLFVAQVFR